MSNFSQTSDHPTNLFRDIGLGRIGVKCKQILNALTEMSNHMEDRRRFAALSAHQLEDIGMTIAERDRLLR